jgi:outer membrane protein TolC
MGLLRRLLPGLSLCLLLGGCVPDHSIFPLLMPEQTSLQIRDPAQMPRVPLPDVPPPPTVADPQKGLSERYLSLDEAIRIGLQNSRVVRVLAGITATSSGKTIYDPAITNTIIDQQRGRFDPTFNLQNTWSRTNTPLALLNPLDSRIGTIFSGPDDNYHLSVGVSKTTVTGATVGVTHTEDRDFFPAGGVALNPQDRRATTLNLTQPLLQGASVAANLAPIVIARINTERSFYQFKDSLQEEVRGIVDAYWSLVFARTDAWTRRQQVRLQQETYNLIAAQMKIGLKGLADEAQARVTLANFKSQLIAADGNVLQREGALRNILGLPPTDHSRLVPVTPPNMNRLDIHWEELLRLAEEQRPDLIDLKLILQADEQALIQARNQALPKVDVMSLYRFNGLSGTTPSGAHVGTEAGQFIDWSVGVNISLPLWLRTARAALRQQQLIIRRDQANLDQGLHAAISDIAVSVRTVAQDFEQYQSLLEAVEAARINLDVQLANYKIGRTILINYLQAVTDWGNAVSAEAQALTQYNTDLANLERQTGTILQTHGVQFYEENYSSIGPWGRLCRPRYYPESMPPTPNSERYPASSEPAENAFNLIAPEPPTIGMPRPQ